MDLGPVKPKETWELGMSKNLDDVNTVLGFITDSAPTSERKLGLHPPIRGQQAAMNSTAVSWTPPPVLSQHSVRFLPLG